MPSAIEQIYNQIKDVFGGNNPNQVFCMLSPGTILDPGSYAYDISGMKPARVQEAESELVNGLFDVAQITGSGNGRHLATQFLMSLNNLVPRFDGNLAKAKNALRDLLNMQPDYLMPDGTAYKGSLQDLYWSLYAEFVTAKQEWEDKQEAKKEELKKTYPTDPGRMLDEFDDWYETVAEAELAKIDTAAGKVLMVFSPADMDAIAGLLDAGPGGAIEEARRSLLDIRKPSPDGGWVYPVNLVPRDWFLDLSSDADPVDLLDAPEFIALKLQARRQALQAAIAQVQGILAAQTDDAKALAKQLSNAQAAYSSAETALLGTYSDNAATAVKIYLAKRQQQNQTDAPADMKKDVDELTTLEQKVDKAKGGTGATPPKQFTGDDVNTIVSQQKALIAAQSTFLSTMQSIADAGMKLAAAQSTTFNLQPMLQRLQALVSDVDTMWQQLGQSAAKGDAPQPTIPLSGTSTARRSAASDRFMRLAISFTADEMDATTTLSSSSSQTSWSVDLFIGSASGSSSSSKSHFDKSQLDSSTGIEVAFSAAKVEIQRGWFDPGVFQISGDLDALTSTRFSLGVPPNLVPETLKPYNQSTLPCFPVSFVVAKDVTIRMQTSDTATSAVKDVADTRAAVSGGFLCFSASRSEASHSESEAVSSKAEGKVVSIHMAQPQIIGWFLEFTPRDCSKPIDSQAEAYTILKYVEDIKAYMEHSDGKRALAAGSAELLALRKIKASNGAAVPAGDSV
jgi:hypothetical protein